MRNQLDAFHLAIPARDLDEAYDFYVRGLGCKLARRYDDRITLAELQTDLARIFARLDADHDGAVTRAECLTIRAGDFGQRRRR